MKSFYGIIILTVFFQISCSTEPAVDKTEAEMTRETFAADKWPQKWQLTEMSGNIASIPPQRGNDMEWQEYYLLFEDGAFIKKREWDREPTQSKGTFRFTTNEFGKYIEFKHDSVNSLVGACVQGPDETLVIASENELRGAWSMCDGPGLVYERVKYDVAIDGL